MSKATEVEKTGNKLHTDFDFSKVFLRSNRFEQINFKNTSGALLTMIAGTLLGRVTATGELDTVKSASVDGSETPVGVLGEESIDFAIGEVREVNVCVGGDVAEEKIVLDGADTLATNIGGRQIRDRINADTLGIKLVKTDQLTGVDNQ